VHAVEVDARKVRGDLDQGVAVRLQGRSHRHISRELGPETKKPRSRARLVDDRYLSSVIALAPGSA